MEKDGIELKRDQIDEEEEEDKEENELEKHQRTDEERRN